MKSDIQRLMAERGLDAIYVGGGEGYSDVRDYLANGAHITGGVIIIKQGSDPILIVNGMEIEEAKASGLQAVTYGDMGYMQAVAQITDPTIRAVKMVEMSLKHAGVESGRVGMYGRDAINNTIALVNALNDQLPDYEFVGELHPSLFSEAMLTKDPDEMERLLDVARRTCEVLEATWDYIAGHSATDDGVVIDEDGTPLTIGDIKRYVRRALLDRELQDTGMIFAQGRDAGFPHSRGQVDMPLKLGQSIVFDLFPQELGGGYHHDVTRTWSIGYASDAVKNIYDQVMQAFDISVEAYGLGKPTHMMQEAVLDFFEGNGHPTQRSQPGAMSGYVHSLGHGLGLNIHEGPSISHLRREDVFQIGNCVTIEPGLYYPDDGLGVRVEDTFVVTEQGELQSITPFKKDLVLPLRGN
ncbi:MAG: aminopeptidase P family protein [Anaerolineae bacterium]|nr:aminopeptidase P family protein [Anaerolineae bacterium]